MKLYIVRHAVAVPRGTSGYRVDSERPLTSEGMKQAKQSGRGLKRLKPKLGLIASSPYVRARQTAEQIAQVYGLKAEILEMPQLKPGADPEGTSRALKGLNMYEGALLVGHEPHLTCWISRLIGPGGQVRCVMKKGGAACVEVDASRPSDIKGTLRWLMTPKQLALIGR